MSCYRTSNFRCPAISVAICLGLSLIGNILLGLIALFGILIVDALSTTLVIVLASLFILFNLIVLIILLFLFGRQT